MNGPKDAESRFSEDLHAQGVLNELAACQQPLLIGIRHHSAAMSRVVPELLDRFAPEVLLLELPPEFTEWLPWLVHPDTQTPIALSGCRHSVDDLFFYPFADFSPELVAVRWALQRQIPIELFDLPIASRSDARPRSHRPSRGLLQRLMERTESDDTGKLWDRLVETRAPASTAEQVRKAALLFGWAVRWNDAAPTEYDCRREQYMRSRIAAIGDQRCAAIIGAYHAAALLPEPRLWAPAEATTPDSSSLSPTEIATALIPYSFEQLDERSGYPAGIRDPVWYQKMVEAADASEVDLAVVDVVVSVCREVRQQGHPMNAADAQEVVRVVRDLARVRALPSPGRQEVMEAFQHCLTQGQLYGAGRVVAQAMQTVLVGRKSGRLPQAMPRCGLSTHLDQILRTLRLPTDSFTETDQRSGSQKMSKRMRLDPLRSALDRAREVVFQQLNLLRIPYATPAADGSARDRQSLTTVWDVEWTSATAAMISLSAARGATLKQAAHGLLEQSFRQPEADWGCEQLAAVRAAAECGLNELVLRGLRWIGGSFAGSARLGALAEAMHLVDQLASAHIPGLPSEGDLFLPEFCQPFSIPGGLNTAALLESAIARLFGLMGSREPADVAAILDLLVWFQQQHNVLTVDAGRLLWTLRQLSDQGSSLMQGAGLGGLLLLGQLTVDEFLQRTGGWLDSAGDSESRQSLAFRLHGLLQTASPVLTAEIELLNGIGSRLDDLSDDEFLSRLPALRKGFAVLSPATRTGLYQQISRFLPDEARRLFGTVSPEEQELLFAADRAARQAVAELLPDLELTTAPLRGNDIVESVNRPRERAGDVTRQLSMRERWHLILGLTSQTMSSLGRRAAKALDEMYGSQSGEGSRGSLSGQGAGQEAPYVGVREWADDLESLFGTDIREEVLGEAAEAGRSAALSLLDEQSVRPSVELLQQVLSLKGALAESQLARLRRIARRITEDLAKELATRLAPSLSGLSTPRPTRRRSRRLDLHRTIRTNLHTVRRTDSGKLQLQPETLFFRTPARRSLDWHVIYVVDVSASMEESVIYSAMTAAVFSALPALSVSFLAFSTSVIDLTEHIDDPLALLLEVQVGGGTSLALGLRAARERIRVPNRTIVLLVTDFEEGFSLGNVLAEVRALTDTGARALGLAALSDDGKPRYNTGIAAQVVSCGMPVAALSPEHLARWVGDQIR
ncbi:MAG: VWA domain-containing protein [Planctomycetaceae bacterium]|nr:VWA domain-containing protein [Planctomycetaceae bacterium]